MEVSFNQMLESESYHNQKELLKKEINSNRLVIDRSVFKKTEKERLAILSHKANIPDGERKRKLTTFFKGSF